MELPVSGVVGSLILLFLICYQKYALHTFLLSSPFSATAFVNIPSLNKSVTISVVFLVIYLMIYLYKKSLNDIFVKNNLVFFAYMFLLSALLSIVIGAPYDLVCVPYTTNFKLTQFIYLLLGVLVAIAIYREVSTYNRDPVVIRFTVYAGLAAAGLAIIQLVSHLYGIQYPSWIFNNSINPNDQGYTAIINGFKRLTGPSTESSILALFLIGILPIAVYSKTFFSTRIRYLYVSIIILALLFSTSLTAYVGLFLFILAMCVNYIFRLKNKCVYVAAFLVLCFLLSYALLPFVEYKLESYSFYERSESIRFALNVFSDYVYFGYGWGTVTVYSLFFGLLANVGIIGFLIFMFWIMIVLYRALKISLKNNDSSLLVTGYLMSVCILLILQSLVGFAYVYSFFWLILGTLMGLVQKSESSVLGKTK